MSNNDDGDRFDDDDDWFDDVTLNSDDDDDDDRFDDVMVNNDGFPSVAHRWRAKLYEPGCSHGWWGEIFGRKMTHRR